MFRQCFVSSARLPGNHMIYLEMSCPEFEKDPYSVHAAVLNGLNHAQNKFNIVDSSIVDL